MKTTIAIIKVHIVEFKPTQDEPKYLWRGFVTVGPHDEVVIASVQEVTNAFSNSGRAKIKSVMKQWLAENIACQDCYSVLGKAMREGT